MDKIGSDPTYTQTNVFYRFSHKTIAFIFVNFVSIEMLEKLRSQLETVISLPRYGMVSLVVDEVVMVLLAGSGCAGVGAGVLVT